MGYLSLLPDHLSTFETWLARIFVWLSNLHTLQGCADLIQLLLGAVTMGPWILVLIYDIILYAWRTITYGLGMSVHGGQWPQAPSLTKRPSGHRKRFSLAALDPKSCTDEHASESTYRGRESPTKRHDSLGEMD